MLLFAGKLKVTVVAIFFRKRGNPIFAAKIDSTCISGRVCSSRLVPLIAFDREAAKPCIPVERSRELKKRVLFLAELPKNTDSFC